MKKNNKLEMKVFSVSGISSSGKTTLVVELVKELTKRGYTVGTAKSIGCGKGCEGHKHGNCSGSNHHSKFGFTIDTTGKNSFKHREAGSKQITTWSKGETAIIYPYQLKLYEIIDKYDFDYLIVEGARRYPMPKITTGISRESTEKRMTNTTIAISGKVADEYEEINGIKTFKIFEEVEKLADLVENKVYPTIGYRDEIGCSMCNMTCKELSEKILKGEKSHLNCKRMYPNIQINTTDENLKEKLRKQIIKIDLPELPEKIEINIE